MIALNLFHSFMNGKRLFERNRYEFLGVYIVKPVCKRSILSLKDPWSMLSHSPLIVLIVIWRGYSREMSKVRDSVHLVAIPVLNRSRRSPWCQLVDLILQRYGVKRILLVVNKRFLCSGLFFVNILGLWISPVSLLLHLTLVKRVSWVWCWQPYRICDFVSPDLTQLIVSLAVCVEIHGSIKEAFCFVGLDCLIILGWDELSELAHFLVSDALIYKSYSGWLWGHSLLLRLEHFRIYSRQESLEWYLVKTQRIEVLIFLGPVDVHYIL